VVIAHGMKDLSQLGEKERLGLLGSLIGTFSTVSGVQSRSNI